MNARRLAPRLALGALVAGLVVWAALEHEAFDPAALDGWLAGLGPSAPVLYVAAYAAGTVAFLPGSLFALAGGALFGPVWGAALNLVGATLGASLAFLAARTLAGGWVARKAGGRHRWLIDGIEAEGWRFVALIRLVPLFPFNLSNYALGLARIGLGHYVVASFVCMAPGALAYTWLGHAGRAALAGDAAAVRYGLAALGLLAAIAFLPRLIKRLRQGTRWIAPEELRQRMTANAVAVLDVRDPDEFAGPLGHIAGAVNLPFGELPDRLSEINASKDEALILVCRTDRRSASAATLLRDAGFRDARVLRGGMERWRALGFAAAGTIDAD